MSWSLQLRGGDLVIDGARLATSTGVQKIIQDLRCAILEPRGFDDFHPTFGSLIDGGIDEYGNNVLSLIGGIDIEYAAMRIDSELRRLAADYQTRQTNRASNDRLIYGESTLTNDELLQEVTSIQMTQAQDKLMVTMTIRTANGQNITVDIPVTNPTV